MKKLLFILIPLTIFIVLFSSKSFAMTQDELKTFLDRENITYNDAQINSYFPSNEIQNYEYVAYIEYNSSNPQGNGMRFYFTNETDLVWIMKNDAFGYGHDTTFYTGARMRGLYYDSNIGFVNSEYNWVSNAEVYVVTSPSNYISNGISYNTIDYDNPVFSSQIPIPNMVVSLTTLPLSYGGTAQTYVNCNINENEAFYIQLQLKIGISDLVRIGLNDGTYTYDYLTWSDHGPFDIYNLGEDVSSVNLEPSDFNTFWSSTIDDFSPEFTTSVPFWLSNPNAAKYLDAQQKYTDRLMLQFPLYGSRMELFARYYAVVDDVCYVGKWVHWNSANPSNTEQLSNQYQSDQPFPGYQNNSSSNDLPEQEDTYNNFGENTSVNNDPYSQVIINNNVPNYPDYPTAVSYNHDNILLQFIDTAKQLPNFFGDFGLFLTTSFAFIPSELWALIGFGFMCSIVVMIIKVL